MVKKWSTYLENPGLPAPGPVWSAPNYLLLLSLAEQGFGWCKLPCALVDEFAHHHALVPLQVPGWPAAISIDLVWNKRSPPGVAGHWLRTHLQQMALPLSAPE